LESFFASTALSHLLVDRAGCHSFFTTVRSVLTIAGFMPLAGASDNS